MPVPKFKELFPLITEPSLKESIEQEGTIKEIPVGTVIMDIGGYIRFIPLVTKGCIKVLREDENGNELFLYHLYPGNTCAMSLTCCLSHGQSKIRAIAEEDVELISLPVKYMDKWMQQYPSWKGFVMNTYSKRFDELLTTIDNIAFLKMDERLLKYLNDKSKALNTLTLSLKHQEIAYELNTHREVISRLLKQLEN